jgi:hypothetical protein
MNDHFTLKFHFIIDYIIILKQYITARSDTQDDTKSNINHKKKICGNN